MRGLTNFAAVAPIAAVLLRASRACQGLALAQSTATTDINHEVVIILTFGSVFANSPVRQSFKTGDSESAQGAARAHRLGQGAESGVLGTTSVTGSVAGDVAKLLDRQHGPDTCAASVTLGRAAFLT